MSYAIQVKKDHPIGFWPLDDSFLEFALDYSGCLNNGTYNGNFQEHILPVCYGVLNATKITNSSSVDLNINNNFYQIESSPGLGNKNSSDNSFSIEAWIFPNIISSSLTTIVGDATNNIGIFYENGNIVFNIASENVFYTLPNLNTSYHVIAVYNLNSIFLYVDGKIVAQKRLNNFLFQNNSIAIQVGPTESEGDYFLINNVSIYRHELSYDKVKLHYSLAKPISNLQISKPEGGEIFEFYDNGISSNYSYYYPANKSWNYFLTGDLYYNQEDNYIEIAKGQGDPKTVVIEDFINIPSGRHLNDSKIEWSGDSGILVETSLDGVSYETCLNGESIPQYKLGLNNFNDSLNLYIKITMSTVDDSKYIPRLSFLALNFYSNQIVYAQNSPSYVEPILDEESISDPQINLSSQRYSILSRNNKNGIRFKAGSGFYLKTRLAVNTIEFFYNPTVIGSGSLFSTSPILFYSGGLYNESAFDSTIDGGLPSSMASSYFEGLTFDNGYQGAKYEWDLNGLISKDNIELIYVNGINQTSETNINNVFKQNELHHVIITFYEPLSQKITFNYKPGGTSSSIYQNLSIFNKMFTMQECQDRYSTYLGANAIKISDSSFTVTESTPTLYNIDWKVLQTV